jgi:hypothetical protein
MARTDRGGNRGTLAPVTAHDETKLMSDKRAGARLVDRRSTRRVPSKGETHCVERVARMATLGLRAAGIA